MADDGLTSIRERQDRQEGRMAALESTVRREATLRAAMDSELSKKLKAHERSMQALHDNQADHTRRLTRIEGDLTVVKDRLEGVEGRLGRVEEGLGTVKIGVHAILDLLNTHLVRKPQ
jgi:chromosome segregation ATPase